MIEDIEYLLLVKVHQIPFSGSRGIVQNVSANQRSGRPSCFSIRPKNINLVEDIEYLLPVKFRQIPFSGLEKKSKLSQSIRDRAAILFSARKKHTIFVEDVELLLPVKFRQLPVHRFREEVENVSANQRTDGLLVVRQL